MDCQVTSEAAAVRAPGRAGQIVVRNVICSTIAKNARCVPGVTLPVLALGGSSVSGCRRRP